MNYVPNLGETPAQDARRDAVHVAVAPVIAGESLKPGQHVGMIYGKAISGPVVGGTIGVVDPFLETDIECGQQFWLFLYPNSVTSLRHVWSHPSFTARIPS